MDSSLSFHGRIVCFRSSRKKSEEASPYEIRNLKPEHGTPDESKNITSYINCNDVSDTRTWCRGKVTD